MSQSNPPHREKHMKTIKEAKLYPNKTQEANLTNLLEQSRHLYNYCLGHKKDMWMKENKKISRFGLQEIAANKKTVPYSLAQTVADRLTYAYQKFFRKGGYPRFKKFGRYRSFDLKEYNADYRVVGDILRFWPTKGFGNIKMRGMVPLINPSRARIVKRSRGWYVQIIDDVPVSKEKEIKEVVGIDYGLKYFIADTAGEKITPPKLFRKSEAKQRLLQRKLSKKKRGGKNWRVAIKEISKANETLVNKRKDFLHKLSRLYADKYDLVSIEDLNIHGMVQNKHLSKSILDASWGHFTNLLHYKLEMLGGRLVKINPYNTSQACSSCGQIVKKTLMTRTHSCMNCGYVADRDENAARNILFLGLDKANREGISVEGLTNYKALMSMSAPSKKDNMLKS